MRVFRGRSLTAVCLVGSLTLFTACAGKSNAPVLTNGPVQHSLGLTRAANGNIKGINDVPRGSTTTNFEARKAAARAKGRWLTAELNLPKNLTVVPNSRQIIQRINAGESSGQTPKSSARTPQVLKCSSCDGGGGDDGGGDVATFDDDGGYSAYDSEIDFTDGTSMLTKEWVDSSGTDQLTVLDPTGQYYLVSVTTTPPSTPPPSPDYCYPMDGSFISCGGAPMKPVPKWACPYVAGGAGLAAKWAVAAKAGGKAGDVAGVLVGVTVNAWCNN